MATTATRVVELVRLIGQAEDGRRRDRGAGRRPSGRLRDGQAAPAVEFHLDRERALRAAGLDALELPAVAEERQLGLLALVEAVRVGAGVAPVELEVGGAALARPVLGGVEQRLADPLASAAPDRRRGPRPRPDSRSGPSACPGRRCRCRPARRRRRPRGPPRRGSRSPRASATAARARPTARALTPGGANSHSYSGRIDASSPGSAARISMRASVAEGVASVRPQPNRHD